MRDEIGNLSAVVFDRFEVGDAGLARTKRRLIAVERP